MDTVLTMFGLLATGVLAWRLHHNGLRRRFRTLFYYCLILTPRSAASLIFAADSSRYAWIWIITELATWVALVVMVAEVHSAIFERFPSLSRIGRRILQWGLAVSVAVTMGLTFAAAPPNDSFPILQALLLAQRVVLGSLVGFLLLQLMVLAVIRVPLKRNALVFSLVFFVYLLAKALLVFALQTVGPDSWRVVSTAIEILSNLAILALAVGLRPGGEELTPTKHDAWDPARSTVLVRQLQELNDALASHRPKPEPSAGESGDFRP